MANKQREYRQRAGTPPAFRLAESITEADVFAIRALKAGEATPYQQQLALRCILVKISGAYDQETVLGHPDQTAFRGGRAFVGRKLIQLYTVEPDKLLGAEHEET